MKNIQMDKYKSLELDAHVNIDDVMHKVLQEVAEICDAHKNGSQEDVMSEVRDALVNILSVCGDLGVDVSLEPSGEPSSPENLLSSLSLWNQKVQSLRGRYMREGSTREEVGLATQALVSHILAYTPEKLSFEDILRKNTAKLEGRTQDYLPDIDLRQYVRAYPDFPKPGILFQDISPMLGSPEAMRYVTYELAKHCKDADVIVGLDARGFLFGMMVSSLLGKPFVMIRKKGKLPGEKESISYGLEYGQDTIEIQKDAVAKGQRVAIIDDLLATGGTAQAAAKLIEQVGGQIESIACVISLDDEYLKNQIPRKDIDGKYKVRSVLSYN